ncbi:hypothetical protein Hdeb2414_s0017g00512941 [Helianthus debilis subsp. tardiflorus]
MIDVLLFEPSVSIEEPKLLPIVGGQHCFLDGYVHLKMAMSTSKCLLLIFLRFFRTINILTVRLAYL